MKNTTISLALLLGLKYGVVAILITVIFLPLPIAIGDYFGRVNTVGYYSNTLPVSWIFGLAVATAIPFSLPFLLGGCVVSSIIVFFRKARRGKVIGAILGEFIVFGGLVMFEKLELLESLGGGVFIGIMTVWGIVLFGWIGNRIQQSVN